MKEMEYQAKRKIELLFDEEYKGYHYYILNLGTHPTAYVEITKGNKLFGKTYDEIYEDDIDIEVHGGLTYSRDYMGYDDLFSQFAIGGYKWTTQEIIKECENVIEQIIELEGKQMKIDYERLLKIAKEMHLWIFLNTGNEFEVYKELGLTDEENLILGSGIVQDGNVYFAKENK